MKLLPFLSQPSQEIVPVGNDEVGVLYLLQKKGITPNENPVDFQEQQKNQQKFLLRLNKRIKQLANENNVSIASMRKKVFGAEVSEKTADGGQVEVAIDDGNETMFDYLDQETAELLFAMQEDKRGVAIRAATYMVRNRTAYPVKLAANAIAGMEQITIHTPNHLLGEGSHIKFGSSYVEIAENWLPAVSSGDHSLLKVKQLITNLQDGTVGFLCDRDSTVTKLGYPEWTEDDTKNFLSEELIAELYQFYLAESGVEPPDSGNKDKEDSEGNLLRSKEQLNQNQLTGDTSLSDSSGLELQTPDSTTKTLETSQVG